MYFGPYLRGIRALLLQRHLHSVSLLNARRFRTWLFWSFKSTSHLVVLAPIFSTSTFLLVENLLFYMTQLPTSNESSCVDTEPGSSVRHTSEIPDSTMANHERNRMDLDKT